MMILEFSKKLLFFSWLITLIVTVLAIWFSVECLPMDALSIIAPLSWAETGTATGYYFWKAKNENRAKYAQRFLKNLAKEYGEETAIRMAEIVLKD